MLIINPIHWHPILVHFSFALLFLAPFFMLAGVLASDKSWAKTSLGTGRVMLWTGVILSVFTVGAGFVAMWNVEVSEQVHHHIHDHRDWALGTAALFAIAALWSFVVWKRNAIEGKLFLILMFLGLGALVVTGNKGGELVFHHGVAVKSDTHSAYASPPQVRENAGSGQQQHNGTGHSH